MQAPATQNRQESRAFVQIPSGSLGRAVLLLANSVGRKEAKGGMPAANSVGQKEAWLASIPMHQGSGLLHLKGVCRSPKHNFRFEHIVLCQKVPCLNPGQTALQDSLPRCYACVQKTCCCFTCQSTKHSKMLAHKRSSKASCLLLSYHPQPTAQAPHKPYAHLEPPDHVLLCLSLLQLQQLRINKQQLASSTRCCSLEADTQAGRCIAAGNPGCKCGGLDACKLLLCDAAMVQAGLC